MRATPLRSAFAALAIVLCARPAPADSLGPWTLGPATNGDWANNGVAGFPGHLYTVTYAGAEVATIQPDGSLSLWLPTASPNLARVAAITLAAGTALYIAGGHTGTDPAAATAMVEVATINADGSLSPWVYTSPMNVPRTNHAGALGAGHVYMLGNYGGSASVESAAILAGGTLGPWRSETAMNQARERPAAAVVHNFLYAIGGLPFTTTVERASIALDGVLGAWQYVTPTQKARYELGAASIGSFLFGVGGYNDAEGAFASVEVSDFAGDGLGAWSYTPSPLNHPRANANATAIGRVLYVAGCASVPQCVVSDNTVEFATLLCSSDADCNDGNPCTDDHCDVASGTCSQTNNTSLCDDGDPCTSNDICQDSVCKGGPRDCDHDGVPDANEDCFCLGTAPHAPVTAKGCSVEQLCPCAAPLGRSAWFNHREYVTCVRSAVREIAKVHGLTRTQVAGIVGAAAQNTCGR